MTNRLDATRLQPVLLGVALVSALLAALALLLSGRTAAQQAQLREHVATLTSLSQNIPLQAGAAVRGSAPAFDALADSRARLERVLNEVDAGKSAVGMFASPSAQLLGGENGWPALLEQSQAVLDGRDAAIKAQKAAAVVRDLTPQVLAAAAGVMKAMGPARPELVNRSFERFEIKAQAVEQDLAALADGTVPVEAASLRLTDSLDYMGQVVGGLAGERNALGLGAASAPATDAARVLSTLFHSESDEVRAVVALGDRIEQMQAARNALAESGTALYAGLARKARPVVSCGGLARQPMAAVDLHPRDAGRTRHGHVAAAPARCVAPGSRAPGAARTSATSRPSCGCSTNCRAWPTAT